MGHIDKWVDALYARPGSAVVQKQKRSALLGTADPSPVGAELVYDLAIPVSGDAHRSQGGTAPTEQRAAIIV